MDRSLPLALLLACGSAVLFGLAFPPAGLWPLAWVALVPFLAALRRASLAGSVALGALVGTLHAYAVGTWFVDAITSYYDRSPLFGSAFFLGMAAVMVAPYYMAFAAVYRLLADRWGRALPFLAAAAWVAAELMRGRLFTGTPLFIGNPWALLGYSHVGRAPIVQIAELTGVYGVSFAIALVNAALVELVLARERPLGRRVADLGLALVPACAFTAYGAMVLAGAPPPGGEGEGTRVAVVQGRLDDGSRWSAAHYGSNLDTYLRLSAEAIREREPALLVWPESAMSFFVADEPAYRRAVASVLGPRDVQLVSGAPRVERRGSDDARYFNSVFVLDPDGEIAGRYDKHFLVPFSEYFPLARVGGMRRRAGSVRVFTHGPRDAPPLATRAGSAGVLVCNEAMLPEVARRRVEDGATYLLNPSNDSWVADPGFAELQFAIVALRSVELRRSLVRASTWGPSAIVDPWGRTLARTGLGARAVIDARVVERRGRTVYARVGDLFAWACVAAVLPCLLRPRRAAGAAR